MAMGVAIARTRTLPADASAPRVARETMRSFGASNPNADVVVSELVTNALIHGALPINLSLERTNDLIHVEVRDKRGDFGPRPDQSRGLQLIEAFSLGWGINSIQGDGKTVWADLAI